MKSTRKIAAIFAGTTALALLLSTSASAEDRHRDGTSRNNDGYRDGSRNNDGRREQPQNYRGQIGHDNHISEKGRIRSFTRERDGYRVYLDHGSHPYWVPASRLGRRQLRVGLDIRLGGIFNGGYVDVDALGYPGDPYYNDPYYNDGGYNNGGYYGDRYDGTLSGRVERVDYRHGTLLLRDDRSGRVVEVDMRRSERSRGVDLNDLHRGDRVTLQGSWDGGYFRAYRIDGVRQY